MNPKSLLVIGDPARMPELKSNSIQLVVTNPPCCNLDEFGEVVPEFYGKYLMSMQDVFCECYRVLCEGRFLCLNVPDPIKVNSSNLIPMIERSGFKYEDEIVWRNRKDAGFFLKNPYCTCYYPEDSFERVFVFKKGNTELYKLSEEEKQKCKFDLNFALDHVGFELPDSMPEEIRDWPQKALYPEELAEALIKLYAYEGETVLDPFLGSGTTIKAARRAGRLAVGYEINGAYLPLIGRKVGFSRLKIIRRGGNDED